MLVLPYINMHPPRVYTCSPSWTPPPTSLPIPSLWVIPVHQPQASCILHRTWTGDSFHIWYYTCFNAILPNYPPPPSPTESKRLFYTSVSLLLSRIQDYRYHLSKFHIYALIGCIGVFNWEDPQRYQWPPKIHSWSIRQRTAITRRWVEAPW